MSDAPKLIVAGVLGWMLAVMAYVWWAHDKVIVQGEKLVVIKTHEVLGCTEDEYVSMENECVHVDVIVRETGDK